MKNGSTDNDSTEVKDDALEGETARQASSKNTKTQFGVAALFWITFIVGSALAYLQRLDSPDILLGGMLSVIIGLAIGAAVGFITKQMSDALFWGSLIAAFGFISVASDPVYGDQAHRLVWAAVGAFAGAIGATVQTKRVALNAIICAIAGGTVMGGYYLLATHRSADLQFDLFGAPFIGFAVAIFIRILMWLENRQTMPRYITATWLLVVVIIGNVIGR